MIDVFIAYSHYDLPYKDELKKFLRPLLREERISLWDDFDIEAGQDWDAKIKERLYGADLVLLLVSADSLASDYFYSKEVKVSLERHARAEAIVVPVILRHCDWMATPLGSLEVLPGKGRPVSEWPSHDKAFFDVTVKLRILVDSLEQKRENTKAESEALQQFQEACKFADYLYKKHSWRKAELAYASAIAAYRLGFEPEQSVLKSRQADCTARMRVKKEKEDQKLEPVSIVEEKGDQKIEPIATPINSTIAQPFQPPNNIIKPPPTSRSRLNEFVKSLSGILVLISIFFLISLIWRKGIAPLYYKYVKYSIFTPNSDTWGVTLLIKERFEECGDDENESSTFEIYNASVGNEPQMYNPLFEFAMGLYYYERSINLRENQTRINNMYKYVKSAADNGDSNAFLLLGDYYDIKENAEKSIEMYEKAKTKGARHEIALITIRKNRNDGTYLLENLAQEGFSKAFYSLGLLYYGDRNYSQALNWFKKMPESVDARNYGGREKSLFAIAKCYERMDSLEKAVQFYKLAVDDGHYGYRKNAANNLGIYYAEGKGGLLLDREKANELFEESSFNPNLRRESNFQSEDLPYLKAMTLSVFRLERLQNYPLIEHE